MKMYTNIINTSAAVAPGTLSPVVVVLQGEAWWWGSGNLYDGGSLAAYGSVVVVTLNFRLGALGGCGLFSL